MGNVNLQLPPGPISNSFALNLYVNIIDNDGGITVYDIPTPVYVYPDTTLIEEMNEILNLNSNSTLYSKLLGGNIQSCAQHIVSYAITINSYAASFLTGSATTPSSSGSPVCFMRCSCLY